MSKVEKKFIKWAKKNRPPNEVMTSPFGDKYALYKFAKKVFKSGYLHGQRKAIATRVEKL